jgi:serine protease Do
VRTDVLGVVVVPLVSEESQAFALEPGLGLRIERVEPGTIAHQLGLQRGQVLVEIDQTPIRTRDDISRKIKERAADGALEVIVVDRWGQRRTRTWKPDAVRQF